MLSKVPVHSEMSWCFCTLLFCLALHMALGHDICSSSQEHCQDEMVLLQVKAEAAEHLEALPGPLARAFSAGPFQKAMEQGPLKSFLGAVDNFGAFGGGTADKEAKDETLHHQGEDGDDSDDDGPEEKVPLVHQLPPKLPDLKFTGSSEEDKDIRTARAAKTLEAYRAHMNMMKMHQQHNEMQEKFHRVKNDILHREVEKAAVIKQQLVALLKTEALSADTVLSALKDQYDGRIMGIRRNLQIRERDINQATEKRRKVAHGSAALRDAASKKQASQERSDVLIEEANFLRRNAREASEHSHWIAMHEAEQETEVKNQAVLANLKLNQKKIKADADYQIAAAENEKRLKLDDAERRAVDTDIMLTPVEPP
eukprot:gnl/TRDRNA2_/TRDRNA2_100231_c0_seq2.p1 gnl/TRDRNA2_/TRDRNA2_100231_c0~~gnl/TRDRNA2_/TRDRNA2_100231_c0_seq2.p1  ORF type:complete len:369 (+),score=84.21 gnl/TRDRNA2_/TRDRNA2_100231_c0_seq2:53-1159(+)